MDTLPKHDLPYFDNLFQKLSRDKQAILRQIGLNVHWGYWEDPSEPDLSTAGVRQAMDDLNHQLFHEARISDGQRILDVGCGLGGAISLLNQRYRGLNLIGLNIDPRQLEFARQEVRANDGNHVQFVNGDACRLPFASDSFDHLLAVECIFHFPSRKTFFLEALRVLRPGGRLVFSDFVVNGPTAAFLLAMSLFYGKATRMTYGANQTGIPCTLLMYKYLLRKCDFKTLMLRDITLNTLPTYRFLKEFRKADNSRDEMWCRMAARADRFLELSSRWRFLRYYVISLEKVTGPN